jgi:ornithine carbamoyltransferase
MSFTSIVQYNEGAYRRIFELAQKVKGIRNRTTTSPLLTNKHILMLIHADKEPQAEELSLKLSTLGCTCTTTYYSASSLDIANLSEEAPYCAVFTIGCTHSATLAIAKESHAPVINVSSLKHSPIHVLADIFPIYEKRDFNFKGVSFCWHGDSENNAHSWLEAAQVLGFDLTLVTTEAMRPDPEILESCRQGSSGRIKLCRSSPDVKGSDVVINDSPTNDFRRFPLTGKAEGGGLHGRGRPSADDAASFWDNELCILMAVMIWIQE